MELAGRLLCYAAIQLRAEAPRWIGRTPWRWTRVSDIAGGRFQGERLTGEVLPSGADWADQGEDRGGQAISRLDVRSVWRTDDGALIYVTYLGRVVIPSEVASAYLDLTRVEALEASDYYFRTTPLFETADERYDWLNGVISVGIGKRTRTGVDYKIYEIL
jgi:hypothetical protein